MNTETMIKELNAVAEKHKNDKIFTFQTNITSMRIDIIQKFEQLAEYEAIGTVEEFREARERQIPKVAKEDAEESVRYCRVYVCPCCHKKSYAKYARLRTVVSNGITLCQKCHDKVHGGEVDIVE